MLFKWWLIDEGRHGREHEVLQCFFFLFITEIRAPSCWFLTWSVLIYLFILFYFFFFFFSFFIIVHGSDNRFSQGGIAYQPQNPSDISPPVFEKIFKNARFAQGGNALFEGKLRGNPKPVVSWTRKGAPLLASNKYQIIYNEITGDVSAFAICNNVHKPWPHWKLWPNGILVVELRIEIVTFLFLTNIFRYHF